MMSLEEWKKIRTEIRDEVVEPVIRRVEEALERGATRFEALEAGQKALAADVEKIKGQNAKLMRLYLGVAGLCGTVFAAILSMVTSIVPGVAKTAGKAAWKSITGGH